MTTCRRQLQAMGWVSPQHPCPFPVGDCHGPVWSLHLWGGSHLHVGYRRLWVLGETYLNLCLYLYLIFPVLNGNGKPIAILSISLLRSSPSQRTGLFHWLLGCEFLGVLLETLLFGKVVALQKTKMGCNAVKAMLVLEKLNTCFIEEFQKEQLQEAVGTMGNVSVLPQSYWYSLLYY